jgi:hypothetical protein
VATVEDSAEFLVRVRVEAKLARLDGARRPGSAKAGIPKRKGRAYVDAPFPPLGGPGKQGKPARSLLFGRREQILEVVDSHGSPRVALSEVGIRKRSRRRCGTSSVVVQLAGLRRSQSSRTVTSREDFRRQRAGGSQFAGKLSRRRGVAPVTAAAAALAIPAGAMAASNPSVHGPPSQSCQDIEAAGCTTPGHSASSPGSPFNEPGINSTNGGIGGHHYSESSQYDVACFQVS